MKPKSESRETKPRDNKNFPSATRTRPGRSGPRRTRSISPPPSAASLVDGELLTEEISLFETLQISPEPNPNPRSFPYSVKQQCWEKAEKIKGRDPDRWRRDTLGNILFRKLVGCPGCLCHDYDHIIPYSKGGKSTLENCQVLQKQQSTGPREIGLRCLKLILFRRVLTAVFQAVIWTFSSCQPMVTCGTRRILADVKFNS